MESIYAAMLLHKAGKSIDEDNVTKVLQAAGVKVDPVRVKALVATLAEINIDEAIKLTPALIPTAAPTVIATPTGAVAEEKQKEEKKEEKKEEAIEGLGALFG